MITQAHTHEYRPAAPTFGQARVACAICGFSISAAAAAAAGLKVTEITQGGFTKTSWSPRSTECAHCGCRCSITYDAVGEEICSGCVIANYIHGHNFDTPSEATRAAIADMATATQESAS